MGLNVWRNERDSDVGFVVWRDCIVQKERGDTEEGWKQYLMPVLWGQTEEEPEYTETKEDVRKKILL